MSLTATPATNLMRNLEVFRALAEKLDVIRGRLEEPWLGALVFLQRSWYAMLAGEDEEARAAVFEALRRDSETCSDASVLLRWLGPRQRTSPIDWLDELRRPEATVANAIRSGAAGGHFGCWFVESAEPALSAKAVRQLRWGIIANELVARDTRDFRLLVKFAEAIRDDLFLVFEPRFIKALVCVLGMWRPALWLRRCLRL